MAVSTLDMMLIFGYFALVLGIGVFSMKNIKDFDDYSVAGRSIPMAILFATVAATLCGGGSTIGRIAFVHKQGIIVLMGISGMALGQVLSGLYIAPKVREAGENVYTVGDLFARSFGRSGRLASSIVAFSFVIALFGVQILAMGRILQTVTGIPLIPAAVISSIITIAYTWAGGMLAVILTDAIQFVVLALGITLCAFLSLNQVGGINEAVQTVIAMGPEFADKVNFFRSDWSTTKIFAFFLTFMFGEMAAPYFIQRYATGASPKDSKWGVTVFGGYYMFFLVTTLVIGVCSLVLQPDVRPDLALTTLIRETLPPGISGLVFGALLAAVMSTGDSFINTAAVIFTRDIYNEFINPKASQQELLSWTKKITIVIGVGGVGIALAFPKIFELMIYVYNLWAPAVIPTLLVALFWKKGISPYAGAPAVAVGLATAFIWGPKVLGDPLGLPSNIVGMAANIITMFVVHQMTKNAEPTRNFQPESI